MSVHGMRVLVLTHRLPFAPNRGDRIRAFHIVKQLAARADVHVVSLVHDREEEAQADTLRRLGVAVSTALVPRVRNLALAAMKLPTVDAADPSAARFAADAAGARPGDRRVAAGRRARLLLRRRAAQPGSAARRHPMRARHGRRRFRQMGRLRRRRAVSAILGVRPRGAVPVGVRGARRPDGVCRNRGQRARA